MTPRHPADWLALTLLPGLGPASVRRLLEHHEDPRRIAFDLPPGDIALAARSVAGSEIRRARRGLRARVDREIRRAEKAGIRIVPCDSPGYPTPLREIHDPPVLLYVRGILAPVATRIAIVGSRAATRYGCRFARELAAGLAGHGIEVVSGGARGIDTAAHHGALDAGGSTIAVLGSGLFEPYPAENHELFDMILDRGALISEFPLDCRPGKSTFPQRNRVVSGLSAGVVVVEAAARSGALITARHAADQGREVYAVPGPATSPRSTGAHRLIQDGAKLVQDVEDVLEELSPVYRGAAPSDPAPEERPETSDLSDLTDDERTVLGMLDGVEAVHADDLALSAPFDVARLQVALFGLQLRGAVDLEPGRYYLLRPRKEP